MAQATDSLIAVYCFKMLPDIMATAQEWMSHKMSSRPPMGKSHRVYSISKMLPGLWKSGPQFSHTGLVHRFSEQRGTYMSSNLPIVQGGQTGTGAGDLTTITVSSRKGNRARLAGLLAQCPFLCISQPNLFSFSKNWKSSPLTVFTKGLVLHDYIIFLIGGYENRT